MICHTLPSPEHLPRSIKKWRHGRRYRRHPQGEEEEEEEEEESPEEGQEKEENDSDTNENGGDSDLDDGKNQGDKIGDDSQDEENELNSLATTQKHRQLREEADKHYRLNAERMKLKYSKAKRKKVLTFSEGDFVSVRIPRIDRSSTDFHRLPCVVVERLGSSFYLYRLRYLPSYTVLKFWFTCS